MAISPSMISAEEQSVRYYILRKPGNTMVPLIPVDQLPFQIHGVPRNLTHRQLSDERWEFLDETSKPATILPLSNPPNTYHFSQPLSARKLKFRAPDHDVRSGIYEPPSGRPLSSSLPSSGALTTVTLPKPSQPRPKSLSDSFAELYPQDAQRFGYRPLRPAPSGIKPDPSKKVYCSHWIATGECKFNAQGCIYKHEMPSTQEELRKIGFTQVPKWYKEKQVFDRQGPTWMQRQQQKQKQEEDEERKKKKEAEEENPASQVSVPASASPADLEEAKLKNIADTLRRARTTRSPTQEAQTPQKGPSKLNVLATGDRSKAEESLLIDLIDLQELDRSVSCASSQSTASSITTVLDEAEEESVPNTKDYTDYTNKSIHPRPSQASIPSVASSTYDSDHFGDDDDEDDDNADDDADENDAPPSITAKAKQQLMARKVYPSKTSTSTTTRTKPSPKPTTAGVRTPPPLPPPPSPTMCEAAPPARQPITTTDPNLLSGKSTRVGESKLVKPKHASGGMMSSRWAPPCYERVSLGALGGQGGQDRGKIAGKWNNGKWRKNVSVE